jgi:Rrf2 family protein
MLTRAADYATRVMVHLATLPAGTRVQRAILAQATDVPDSFLSKVLQELVAANFVASKRGVDGGFELAMAPEQISLLDVVQAIEGPLQLNTCVGADGECHRSVSCAAHLVWIEAQDAVVRVLKSANIASLARLTLIRKGAPLDRATLLSPA